MTEDEITELVKRLRQEAMEFYGMSGEPSESELFVLNEDSHWQAADAIESLRASLSNAEKEIADLKYRLEAARMFTEEVGDELPGEEIEKMKDIIKNIVLHRRTKK
jgi:hypothetical protein